MDASALEGRTTGKHDSFGQTFRSADIWRPPSGAQVLKQRLIAPVDRHPGQARQRMAQVHRVYVRAIAGPGDGSVAHALTTEKRKGAKYTKRTKDTMSKQRLGFPSVPHPRAALVTQARRVTDQGDRLCEVSRPAEACATVSDHLRPPDPGSA
ncbi:hypothetical protein EDB86DRAFT_2005077 [Lactarius hatsudake]|nr:hypothetical protein EDB86DRAFT_2005077 [Lactarius hatsudake]